MPEPVVITVDNVSKVFRLPHEKQSSLKGLMINRFHKGKSGFESQEALKDVSFNIEKGDFFAIVGRNGSGKSTLLKMLAGIYAPTRGSITINGKLTPFIELGVGFSPELSGRENVYLNGALLGFNRAEMDAMYEDIVDFAELERFMDQKLKNYSSGMQVRLAFSIAIRAKSDILLLDEVLAVGDAAFQQKCFDYFEELKQQKKTVVFVSHDMTAVSRFCNKAVYIKDGVLLRQGSPEEVADLYIEDNVRNMKDAPVERADLPEGYKLSTRIVEQNMANIVVEAAFASTSDNELYLAFSLIKDGIAIAELTTPETMKLIDKGTIRYTLDTSILNNGIYEIPMILCLRQNRELVAISQSKNRFIIKGSDPQRGSALKLADTWLSSVSQ